MADQAQSPNWERWVGPCAHGRDPWPRCDTCCEAGELQALVWVWEASRAEVARERERAEAAEQAACGLAFDFGRLAQAGLDLVEAVVDDYSADHHRDDCPGDCEEHAVGHLINEVHRLATDALRGTPHG